MATQASGMETADLSSTEREAARLAQANTPIEYSQPLEVRSSELQRVWTKTIAGGPYKRSSYYKKIAVLTLSFHPDFDDLGDGVQEEVGRLSNLFRKSFNYPVKNVKLRPAEDAQVVINDEVARFVRKHHGLNHLLIVYYAGHGRPGENHGELVVFNKPRQLSDAQKNERFWNQAVVWNTTESILRSAKSPDVFVIFDCCHAGDLVYKRGLNRSFEYLGATGPGQVTEVPGNASFTSALIPSLQSLLDEKGCFTSSELADRINNHHAFPNEQHPVLSDRDQNVYTGRIMLHALPKPGEVQERSLTSSTSPTTKPGKILTLHFDFEGDPSEADIERLADYFNSDKLRCMLPVDQIRWGGLRQPMIYQVVENWKAAVHGRTLSSIGPLTPPRTALRIPGDHELAVYDPQSPLTPSSEVSGRDEELLRLSVPGKRQRLPSSSSTDAGRRTRRRA